LFIASENNSESNYRYTGNEINTSIAAMMEFLNAWEKEGEALPKSEAKKFIQILSPFAPLLLRKFGEQYLKKKNRSVFRHGQSSNKRI
jgi:leucyl-tRNA synthetase